MSLDEAIKDLENAVAKDDVSAIDRSVNAVLSYNRPDSIGPMLRCLQDDSLYDEGMYSLIHAAESFDEDLYIDRVIECVPDLVSKSPAWASVVLMRVLNSDSARVALVRKIRVASKEQREVLLWLITEIDKQSPEFSAKTTAPLLSLRAATRR